MVAINRRAAIVAGTAAFAVPALGIRAASAAALANLPWSGTGIGAEFIGNQGNYSLAGTKITGFRFKARHTGELLSVAVHTKIASGYGAGTKGSIRVRVFANNSSTGKPLFTNEVARSHNRTDIDEFDDGTVLKFELYVPQAGSTTGVLTGSRFSITTNVLYHVIFENTDASASANYSSVNWGNLDSSPRLATTPGPWSPYWDQEITWGGNRASSISSYTVNESGKHQPTFQLRINPSNGDPDVYWGPINLIGGTALEQQTSPSDPNPGKGSIYKITNQLLLRQKFKSNRTTAFDVTKVRVAPMHWGPSGDVSNLKVILRVADGTARGAVLGSANFTTSDSLYLGSSYQSPWDNIIMSGSTQLALRVREETISSSSGPLTINTTDTYYLEFIRSAGSSTFGIPVSIDHYNSPDPGELTQPAWEGWSTSSTMGVCQAEWSGNYGGSWGVCSIYDDVAKPFTEVRARLVV